MNYSLFCWFNVTLKVMIIISILLRNNNNNVINLSLCVALCFGKVKANILTSVRLYLCTVQCVLPLCCIKRLPTTNFGTHWISQNKASVLSNVQWKIFTQQRHIYIRVCSTIVCVRILWWIWWFMQQVNNKLACCSLLSVPLVLLELKRTNCYLTTKRQK